MISPIIREMILQVPALGDSAGDAHMHLNIVIIGGDLHLESQLESHRGDSVQLD